jgi:hypothetical protein
MKDRFGGHGKFLTFLSVVQQFRRASAQRLRDAQIEEAFG